PAADDDTRAFLLPDLDVAHHRLQLRVADRRPHLHAVRRTVADAQRLHAAREFREELIVYPLVHDDAARGRAPLPRRPEAAPDTAFHRQLQLRIVHHHDDVLAAHLEVHLLEA